MNGISIKRILAPTDFSEASMYALNYAVVLADKLEAKLYLYHCIADVNNYIGYIPSFPGDEVMKNLRENAIKQMEHLEHKYNLKNVENVIEAGDAARKIVEFAKKQNIDLIVIGAHGKSGIERFMFGSVTEKVMRTSDVPVLEVKPPHQF